MQQKSIQGKNHQCSQIEGVTEISCIKNNVYTRCDKHYIDSGLLFFKKAKYKSGRRQTAKYYRMYNQASTLGNLLCKREKSTP
ncbi:hypothetical protein SDC9_191826 [bioreactor metagenome]|jgi:hypothetical protein|uniref:Uncharacterized protein n=1 Tax=bioreactor metagenome TaxID=1076179 RepID=A0A645I785_9ZZZZ